MTINELSEKTGLTVQAIYKQIRDRRAYGRYFKRNMAGKWEFQEILDEEISKRGFYNLEAKKCQDG